MHLESGEDVVIVRGTAKDLGRPAQVPDVVAALPAKYAGEDDRQYLPDADPYFNVVYAITLSPFPRMMAALEAERRIEPGEGHRAALVADLPDRSRLGLGHTSRVATRRHHALHRP